MSENGYGAKIPGVITAGTKIQGTVTTGQMVVNDWVITMQQTAEGGIITARRGTDVQTLTLKHGGGSGVAAESNVFIAEIGVTTFDEVYAAYAEGRVIAAHRKRNDTDEYYSCFEFGLKDTEEFLFARYDDTVSIETIKLTRSSGVGLSAGWSVILRHNLLTKLNFQAAVDETLAQAKASGEFDGTSFTVLGSYDTLEELMAAHPTGNLGDGYLVGGYLYVWNGPSGGGSSGGGDNSGGSGGGGLTEIPIASATVLGGVRVGANLRIDENGVLSVDATNDME